MTKTIDNEMEILLSASEAAMLLGVSRATFKDMVHQYDLPRLRVNKAIKYPKKALLERINHIATHFQEYLSLEDLLA
ncbi:helix-turn-helix domain-containing protein [Weissella paramesenteroides]|uniref:Helix-turn-helix domain-containing protein n=1 Tax=Weissella jogaejeotgali TaxID=1631871 RepID=A0A1L6RD02_9LACO|nr:helix-turn-helix domain-containing protein [Weissella jogaejeotgali]APS42406.1 hypothetical protein FOL01_1547 [Weissella jogaejeotgali]